MSARKECRTCGSDIFPPDCNFELETEIVEACAACPQAIDFDESELKEKITSTLQSFVENVYWNIDAIQDHRIDDLAEELMRVIPNNQESPSKVSEREEFEKIARNKADKLCFENLGKHLSNNDDSVGDVFTALVEMAKWGYVAGRLTHTTEPETDMDAKDHMIFELTNRIAELEQRLQVAELDLADANHQVAELEAELQAYEIGSSFEARRADKLEARLAHCRTRKTINGEDVKMKYTFESVAYDNTKVTVTLEADTLTDVVEAFEQFLRGSGFYFEGRLDLTQEDKKDVEDFV